MNPIGLKKWILRALRSTFKEGSHEKEENSKNVKRSRFNFLRLEFCNVRSNKVCNKLRKLGISNILKTIGLLLIAPSLIFGSWILLSKLLGIPNEILRPLLIWLFIFSFFFSGVIVGLVYQYKEKRRLKKMKCPLECKLADKEFCNTFLSSFGVERVKVLGCNMREPK